MNSSPLMLNKEELVASHLGMLTDPRSFDELCEDVKSAYETETQPTCVFLWFGENLYMVPVMSIPSDPVELIRIMILFSATSAACFIPSGEEEEKVQGIFVTQRNEEETKKAIVENKLPPRIDPQKLN